MYSLMRTFRAYSACSGASTPRHATTTLTNACRRQTCSKRALRPSAPLFGLSRSYMNVGAYGNARLYSTSPTSHTTVSHILPADLKQVMRNSVASRRDKGDTTPTSMMRLVVKTFLELQTKQDLEGLKTFFLDMATELRADMEVAKSNAEAFLSAMSTGREEATVLAASASLRSSLSGSYEKLFEMILAQPNGMKTLIDMRAQVLKQTSLMAASVKGGASELKESLARLKMLESAMRAQLQDWFSIGFLDLRRITWESPAVLLEKIMAYSNSVHPMSDWMALKTRLSVNRRCFGFFHPSMPHEPLVFIEVALTDEISSKIAPILQGINSIPESAATTAIFYAITSTQPGLSGVDLGHMLIEHVVQELKREFPHITTFSTFSPVPSFKSWLDTKLSLSQSPSFNASTLRLSKDEEKSLIDACNSLKDANLQPTNGIDALNLLIKQPNWHANPTLSNAMQTPLTRLCATYIANERKRDLAVDPVANFHLRNGAEFHRVCWMADTSSKRMQQSLGLMVNYLYRLDNLVENNEAYLTRGVIATGDSVKELVK